MGVTVRFLAGGPPVERVAAEGARLLDVAQAAGLPLEGTCNGQLACATCHLLVAPEDHPRLPPAAEEEEELLDLLPTATRHSRLACQIRLSAELGAVTVRLPPGC